MGEAESGPRQSGSVSWNLYEGGGRAEPRHGNRKEQTRYEDKQSHRQVSTRKLFASRESFLKKQTSTWDEGEERRIILFMKSFFSLRPSLPASSACCAHAVIEEIEAGERKREGYFTAAQRLCTPFNQITSSIEPAPLMRKQRVARLIPLFSPSI